MYDDDEFSDLTDISDDDYVGGSSTKKKSQRKSKDANTASGFKVKNALKVPRPTTYTVQSLYDQIHSCDINLEPDYQREVVWPEAKQIGIIDSVFRNFYIPPVIFAVNTFDDGAEARTCIDGKQRLTSIYRFMDGLIPHKDPLTGEKLWYKDVGQSKRPKRLLPEKYRRLFANKQIVCVEYHDITDQDEREIFQRVQLGMALTPAEKLQVVNSPRAQFVRELQLAYLKEEGTGLNTSSLDWDRSRGVDFRCLAQAVYVIDKYSSNFKTSPTIVQLEKYLSDEATPFASFKKKITDTFDIFVLLVHEKTMKSVFKKPAKVSPIELILIVVLIAVCKDKMSLSEVGAAIGGMRDDVRSYHADIRMNTKVTKTMMDYIRNLKPGKVPSEQTIGYMVAHGQQGPPPAASKSGGKRKRNDKMDVDDDSDEDSSDEVDELEDERAEQSVKKAKKPPPAARSTASSNTETIVTKFGPPTRALSSTSTKAHTSQTPSSATASASASVPPPSVSSSRPPSGAGDRGPLSPTQPPFPPSLPRMDRLAGVRAARAAMANVGTSDLSRLPAPGLGMNASNGLPSPRTPNAFPSPSLSFSGFKGGLGIPVPPPSFPGPQLSTQPPVSSSNAIPLPPQNQNPGFNVGFNPGQESESEKREREKKDREHWELGRYGRLQRSEQDYSAPQGSSTNAGGSGKGSWSGGNNFPSDNGWGGRRGQAK
ncbi:hypothetical protein JOM56_004568 [Amanita muscaria]